jgi:hypothetical protein
MWYIGHFFPFLWNFGINNVLFIDLLSKVGNDNDRFALPLLQHYPPSSSLFPPPNSNTIIQSHFQNSGSTGSLKPHFSKVSQILLHYELLKTPYRLHRCTTTQLTPFFFFFTTFLKKKVRKY